MVWYSILSLDFTSNDEDDDVSGEDSSSLSRSPGRTRHGATIYLRSSPLALTKPEYWYAKWLGGSMLFNVIASFHTSHWGLEIRTKHYDLKRYGSWPNARTSVKIVDALNRKQREGTTKIALGMTHFDDYELNEICEFVSHALTILCSRD